MMDQLHSTAYQTSPNGNSLGQALEGTTESIASISAGDVSSVLAGITGSNVVVVGTGSGVHDKLVEEASAVLGKLSSDGGSGKEVVSAEDKSAFIGSDVRYVAVLFIFLYGIISFVEDWIKGRDYCLARC